MCPNDGQPRRWHSLHEDEEGSDVKFLVGQDRCLIPGHRSVLAKANPVFKAMFEGGFPVPPPSEPIHIVDVDDRAFENLLRFLYGREVSLRSVTTALFTLQAAYRYLCADLVNICIAYLDEHIEVSTVLEIFSCVRLYTQHSYTPSAPPLCDDTPTPTPVPAPHVMPSCDKLLHNALNFIDHHADEVLAQESVEEVSVDALESILCRDTLAVSTETLVFDALSRWCNRECKKRHLQLTEENHRRVLGDEALYLVRYLLMSKEDFISGPMKDGWLDHKDSAIIMAHIVNHPLDARSKNLEDKWPKLNRPRSRTHCGNYPLSSRTRAYSPGQEDAKDCAEGKGKKKCRSKDKKRKSRSSLSPDKEKRSTGSKIAECICGAIACILD